jgi:hypothetical protein
VSDPPGGERPAGDAQDRPARGRLRRTARLAALPAAHAGRAAVGLGRRLGGAPAEAVTAQVQARTAEQLFRTLGELKGGAMKVGQAMSAMEAALPAELAQPYREALVRLQDAAPPMPAGVVHRVLDQSFPAGWRHLFRRSTTVRWRPRASVRSTGPCGRTGPRWPSRCSTRRGAGAGRRPRHPRHAGAARPAGRARSRPRALFAALRDRLADEVDYVLEADAQTAFAEAFAGDPDIAVPQVLVVEDRVLVTEWMDGTPVSRVIADGSRADRDRCGLLLLRLLLSSPRRVGRLHGDPHPGNFRLLPDGRLGVLDFGSTEAVPTGWPARLGGLLTALRDEDAEALHGVASAAGLVRGDEVDAAALLALLGPYGEPLRTPRYRFERSWLQGQVRRTSDPAQPGPPGPAAPQPCPTRHLLLQRVAVGLAGVLTLLGAQSPVDARCGAEVAGYA